MRLQLGTGQDTLPRIGWVSKFFFDGIECVGCFERTALGKVSFEVGRINLEPAQLSWPTKFDDGPIMTRSPAAFSFPAVTHIYCAARHDQVMPVPEKHIAAGKHAPSVFDGRQVYVSCLA